MEYRKSINYSFKKKSMNDKVLTMKQMKRAMQPYVLMLYELVYENKMSNVLELGVRQGQSTRTILSALEELGGGTLTSIDLRDRTDRIKSTFPSLLQYWDSIVGDSHEQSTLDKVSKKKYDMLLLDGDHSISGIRSDYKMYVPLVKKGGIVLIHDIYNENETMIDFWSEVEAEEKFGFSHGFAGMGIIKV